MSEDRIIELEIKVAYQEELLDTLNSIIARQQKQLDQLGETCKMLHEKIQTMSLVDPGKIVLEEIPPHY